MSLWYKRYPAAAFDGMRCLTLEEVGAYNIIIDLIYERNGNVPDDDRIMSGWLRCAVQRWRRIKTRLIDLGKIVIRNGFLTNARADKEMADLRTSFEEHRKRSQRGGQVSAEKRNKNNEGMEPTVQPLKTQNETPIGKKESQSFTASNESIVSKENVVLFESASRGRLSAEESVLADGQEERPVQRASDFATDDGNVVITHEQFTKWDEKYPAVSNKRGRLRHAARSWLDEREQSKFEQRFDSYLVNEQRKAAAKQPKQTASEKRAADQASKDREKRSAAAAEFQKRQDEKIRQRRAGAKL